VRKILIDVKFEKLESPTRLSKVLIGMLSTSSQKVIPVGSENEQGTELIARTADIEQPLHNNENEAKSDIDSNSEGENVSQRNGLLPDFKSLQKRGIYHKLYRKISQISYENVKSTTRYFVESARIEFSISVSLLFSISEIANFLFQFEDIILLITIYVLFVTDIMVMSTTKETGKNFTLIALLSFTVFSETPISISLCVAFCIFAAELLVNTWCKTTIYSFWPFVYEGYFLTFFWWLDLISTVSLLPDINFIADAAGMGMLAFSISGNVSYTQAGRVVRLVRLVRLVRVYRIASEKKSRQEHEEALIELARIGAITWEEVENQKLLFNQRQSRLGKQLSESITRRVIIMIIILLIIIPVLSYSPDNYGPEFGAFALNAFNTGNVSLLAKQAAVGAIWDSFKSTQNDNRYIEKLVFSSFEQNPFIYYPANMHSIRDVALLKFDYFKYDSATSTTYTTEVTYSLNSYLRQVAMYDILTTIFVGIMMIGGAIVFSNDAEVLVIKPIERMVALVDAVAQNPLGTFSFEVDGDNKTGQYETKLLEATVEKITGLLRVGFGEAGAGIISANLSAASGGATINPLLPGVRVYAIFGFCDIHHFEDVNQKLANDVLIFINTIAEIVHSRVHGWHGQCNKNLGNAFVVVWRIGDEVSLKSQIEGLGRSSIKGRGMRGSFNLSQSSMKSPSADQSSESEKLSDSGLGEKKKIAIDLKRVPGVDVLADHALIGYLKIIAEINRNKAVLKYRRDPKLTDNGKSEFKVRMGFGLHAGWAIEGAVGSIQKVDATYLSPHVNMAARLETSSRQYGVPLLASQDFYDLLSPDGQNSMRKLDVVTVKGSEVPIGIYTYDALQDQDFKDDKKNRPSFEKGGQSRKSFEAREKPSVKSPSPQGTFISTANNPTNIPTPSNTNNSGEPTPPGSGTSSPVRRPSLSLLDNKQNSSTKAIATFLTPDDLSADIFDNDYDLVTLRSHVTADFVETHKAGITAYLNGDWIAAKECLEKADSMMLEAAPSLGGDGPSKTILNYMKNREFKCPSDWKGYRPLTSK
jgi:class 3 adenylate cyclase